MLYTPYTGVSVTPGEDIDYDVTLINNTGSIQTASFSMEGLPKNWKYSIEAGGMSIDELSVKPGKKQEFTLTINVPLKVKKGDYQFTLTAHSSSGMSAALKLSTNVTEKGTFQTALEVEQPNMQGHADADFTYTATLSNKTAEKQRYALSASAPKGWDVVFKVDGQAVTSVQIEPNGSQDIDVTLNPPENVKAETYKIRIKAESGSTSAKNVLEAVITGSYDMLLTTPSGNLSADITAGHSTQLKLKLVNKGTAPIRDINLKATTPPDWTIEFEDSKVDVLKPGKSKVIKATLTASENAIAGDYITKITASSDQISSHAKFRISVKTSMLWGWIGVIVVLAVVAGIYYLFRRYGRR